MNYVNMAHTYNCSITVPIVIWHIIEQHVPQTIGGIQKCAYVHSVTDIVTCVCIYYIPTAFSCAMALVVMATGKTQAKTIASGKKNMSVTVKLCVCVCMCACMCVNLCVCQCVCDSICVVNVCGLELCAHPPKNKGKRTMMLGRTAYQR